jgi:ATP-dependent RNA helicase DeaD
LQISKDIKAFAADMPLVKVAAIYGGDSYVGQHNALYAGPQVIVATPGRMVDMLTRGSVKLDDISWLILDEADEMLKMGFKDELDAILEKSPATKQTLLFSATMDRTVERIAKTYMKSPKEISASIKNQGSANISHEYYVVQAREKYEALKRILDAEPDMYGIIFCNTRLETQHIASMLVKEKYTAAAISGELSQPQRENVMMQFRSRLIKILVATDVAARGIDVKDLTHVIHYGLPTKVEHYTHRSGRTGRAHSTGTSVAIIHVKEKYLLGIIERQTGISFKNKPIPSTKDICTAQLLSLVEKITTAKKDPVDLSEYLPIIEEKLAHLTREELVHHLVSVELGRFINFYKNLPDLHSPTIHESRPERFTKNKLFQEHPYSPENMGWVKISIGRRAGFSVPNLFALVNSVRSIKGVQIGTINIEPEQTVFEVPKEHTTTFVSCLNGKIIGGTKLTAELVGVPTQDAKNPAIRGTNMTPKSAAPSKKPSTKNKYLKLKKKE